MVTRKPDAQEERAGDQALSVFRTPSRREVNPAITKKPRRPPAVKWSSVSCRRFRVRGQHLADSWFHIAPAVQALAGDTFNEFTKPTRNRHGCFGDLPHAQRIGGCHGQALPAIWAELDGGDAVAV